MIKLEHFPFYVNYADVDDYCFWLLDTYGDTAKCIALIDDHFTYRIDNPDVNADVLLLEIRQCLVDNGFKEEVAACDQAFAAERAERGIVNPYIPMHKRWEMDDAR